MKHNIILNSDSYKYSMFNQYPEGTETVYSYIESRGGKWPSTVFFGLQAFIKEYLLEPITQEDIDIAEQIITAHGEPFYREGWEYILNAHNGFLPVNIKAVPEGTVVPVKNVLATIENTDPKCFWLTTFLETALLRAIWYPTSVATNSYESKKIILKWLEKNGDDNDIDFKLHDFGARGVSSLESSALGGAAHLVNFCGTDNVASLVLLTRWYGVGCAGFSVPAMEHSTVTSWGRDSEVESYRNMIRKNPNGVVSIVSDSYNIYQACEMFGTVLKQDIIDNNVQLVVRPDSGVPAIIVSECLFMLDQYFGHTVNDKGYKVLNTVRVLQGDGITGESIDLILKYADSRGYSADNILFGQGGALLQQLDRDTQKWAMKCSAIKVNGTWREVFKDPITDPGKTSKKGRVTLYKREDGTYYSGLEDWPLSELKVVFENGKLFNEITFDQVRENARLTQTTF
jgi:nicotinamide phosphoribosyltransferase